MELKLDLSFSHLPFSWAAQGFGTWYTLCHFGGSSFPLSPGLEFCSWNFCAGLYQKVKFQALQILFQCFLEASLNVSLMARPIFRSGVTSPTNHDLLCAYNWGLFYLPFESPATPKNFFMPEELTNLPYFTWKQKFLDNLFTRKSPTYQAWMMEVKSGAVRTLSSSFFHALQQNGSATAAGSQVFSTRTWNQCLSWSCHFSLLAGSKHRQLVSDQHLPGQSLVEREWKILTSPFCNLKFPAPSS